MADGDKVKPQQSNEERISDFIGKADQLHGDKDGSATVKELMNYMRSIESSIFDKKLELEDALQFPGLFPKGTTTKLIEEIQSLYEEREELGDTFDFVKQFYIRNTDDKEEFKRRLEEGSISKGQVAEIFDAPANLAYVLPEVEIKERLIPGFGIQTEILPTHEGKLVDGEEFVPKLDKDKDGKVSVDEFIEGKGYDLIKEKKRELGKEAVEKAAKEYLEEKSRPRPPGNAFDKESVDPKAPEVYNNAVPEKETELV